MKNYIKKIIYNDDQETILHKIEPFNEIPNETYWEKYKRKITYQNQFWDFQKEILKSLHQDFIKEYAIDNLDLIDEDDCDCEKPLKIQDFNNDDLMHELKKRGLIFTINQNILNEDFLHRFSKIIDKENEILLDNILTEFEKKLKII